MKQILTIMEWNEKKNRSMILSHNQKKKVLEEFHFRKFTYKKWDFPNITTALKKICENIWIQVELIKILLGLANSTV